MASLVAVGLLASALAPARAQQPLQCPSGSGNMPDLGYCEPDWYPITHGQAWDPAIVPNEDIQTWGDIVPGQQQASLCKWSPPAAGSQPGARGTCKTDISWIISSANIRKTLFDSQMMNYILRFQLYGACYRSTQYSDNDKSQYCAAWWLDSATNRKINASHICYDIIQWVEDPWTKQQVQRKWGCAHNAPVNGWQDSQLLDTGAVAAPPAVNGTAPAPAAVAPVPPPAPIVPVATTAGTTTVPDPGAGTGTPIAPAAAPAATGRRLMQAGVATSAATEDTAGDGTAVPVGPPANATQPQANATAPAPPPPAPVNATQQAPGAPVAPIDQAPPAMPAAPATPTPAAAPGSIGTLEEFMTGASPYNGQGLEFNEARNTWYNCHAYTTAGTPQRETCYMEAFGATFGRDADTLRRMLSLIQQEGVTPGAGPRCSEHFGTNMAQQGATGNQEWCEGATSDYIVSEILVKQGWVGTPAQPYNLNPSLTPPPPPFPPPPPPPPAAPPPPPISQAGRTQGGQATFRGVQTETQNGARGGVCAAAAALVAAAAGALVL